MLALSAGRRKVKMVRGFAGCGSVVGVGVGVELELELVG
jgi:hypothetical protein